MEVNLLKASENGRRPQVARLSETHVSGSGFFSCDGLIGWADVASFVVYEVDDNGEPVVGSETDWIATKNGSTLQNAELTAGQDRDYSSARTYLVATETAGGRNRLIDGLKNTLDDEGKLKENIINDSNIADNSLSGSNIADNSLSGSKIVDGSIQASKLAVAGDHYIRLGSILIQWGMIEVTVPGGDPAEYWGDIIFPIQFNAPPEFIAASMSDIGGIAGEYTSVPDCSAKGMSVVAGHARGAGTQSNVRVYWLAIGQG